MAITFTDSNFEELVEKSGKPALVDLWAEWCGPCRQLTPIVEELAEEYGDKVVIGKLDVDKNPSLTAKFMVRNIPTILFFKDGKMVDKIVGAVPKSKLQEKINSLL